MTTMNASATYRGFDLVGTGFVVLDRIHVDGACVGEALGGTCGNVLIALAALGWSVAPLIRIGNDGVGRRLIEEFRRSGANADFIAAADGGRTPIVAQHTDLERARHRFTFFDRASGIDYPRFAPIESDDVLGAALALAGCKVFFADRVSPTILAAMRLARDGGATVMFEPSDRQQPDLFEAAIDVAAVVKFSADRIDPRSCEADAETSFVIVTHGPEGADVRAKGRWVRLPAVEAPTMRDASGAGDMVTVGLLDAILRAGSAADPAVVLAGVAAGQRLAAANCAHVGARGFLQALGASHARSVLDGDGMS